MNGIKGLEKAASKEAGRYAMNYVRIGEGKATATDGRVLAVVPLPGCEGVEDVLIHRKDFASWVSGRGKGKRSVDVVGEQVRLKRADGAVLEVASADLAMFPAVDGLVSGSTGDDAIAEVTVNPKYLKNLLEAMGSDERVTIALRGEYSAVILSGDDGSIGIIMPITSE